MSSLRTCQKCGGDLRAGSLEGLCARCLANLAFPPGGESDGRPGNFPSFAFGDYELIEEIARGGMGVVYKANQKKLNRLVALKMILNGPFSSAEFVRRFKTEAETIARLKHPNIVTIYEVGERDGHHYLAMELINGRSLAEVVRDNPLEPRRAAIYLQTIARATQYAHECGVVHRDLKPSNLLLDLLDQPHVTDFGLAKLVNASGDITVTNQALGSPGYMAPENVSGRKPGLEKLGDVYSLGAVLYHLLTGRAPFQGEALQEVLMQVQNDDPLPIRRLNPGVPVALETICLKCLNKDPLKRYASAEELADDLGRFLSNEPIVAKPVTWLERMILWAKRRPIQTALSLALAGTFLAGVLGVFLEWRKAERNALGEAQERQTASRYAETMRINLYAADVNLASRALEQSDLGRAREVLEGLRPKAGEADIRGFEWRYLHQRCQGDELATLGGHEWIVTCAAFSPDGHQLLTGSQDGTAKLWDVEHQRLLYTFAGSTSSVWTVDFLPDGSKLLISGLGRQVELWDAKTFQKTSVIHGQISALAHHQPWVVTADSSRFYWEHCGAVVLWNYQTGEKLREFANPGRAVAISTDDHLMASVKDGKGVDIWELSTGRLIKSISTEEPVWGISFSPSGKELLTSGWTTEVTVWNLEKEELARKIKGHQGNVWEASFSKDGNEIVTAGSDQTIRIWDAATLKPLLVLRGHENEVWCARFSPDGLLVASGSKDRSVKLWLSQRMVEDSKMPNVTGFRPLFSPDGKQVMVITEQADKWQTQVWGVENHKLLAVFDGFACNGFSADGKELGRFNLDGEVIDYWNQAEKKMRKLSLEVSPPMQNYPAKTGFSQSGEKFFAVDETGRIRIWNTADGKLLNTLQGPLPPIRTAVFSPHESYLAISVERESMVRLYRLKDGLATELKGHHDFVCGVAFSPDEQKIATGSVDGNMKLWETSTARELASLRGHLDEATDVAFTPDGLTLASIGINQSLIFWQVASLRELFTLPVPDAGSFLQFSPDGNHLLFARTDNQAQLLDAQPLSDADSRPR